MNRFLAKLHERPYWQRLLVLAGAAFVVFGLFFGTFGFILFRIALLEEPRKTWAFWSFILPLAALSLWLNHGR